MTRLSNKMMVFVEQYIQCWNGAEAARRAGYKRVYKAAYNILHREDVKEYIAQRISEVAMSADEVLLRLAEHARGDIGDFIQAGIINIETARAAGKLHLVRRYSEAGKQAGASIELYDAQAALEKLGKHLGVFHERVEMSGPNGGPIEVYELDAAIEQELARLAGTSQAASSGTPASQDTIP